MEYVQDYTNTMDQMTGVQFLAVEGILFFFATTYILILWPTHFPVQSKGSQGIFPQKSFIFIFRRLYTRGREGGHTQEKY
jgi:hypothetical protein